MASHLTDNSGGIDVGSSQGRLQDGRAGQELPKCNRRTLDNASIENGDRVKVFPEEVLQSFSYVLHHRFGFRGVQRGRRGGGGNERR